MAYVCEIGTGQRVYLENQGTQTIVTTASTSPGQQQQSSHSFATGSWTVTPESFHTGNGIVLKITSSQGQYFIQLQGSSMRVMGEPPSLQGSQQVQLQQVDRTPTTSMSPMQPMKPIEPMQPRKMGDMEMKMNPMQMRIGSMEMQMGAPDASKSRFCSQCGTQVSPSDRFCSACGHRLQ